MAHFYVLAVHRLGARRWCRRNRQFCCEFPSIITDVTTFTITIQLGLVILYIFYRVLRAKAN